MTPHDDFVRCARQHRCSRHGEVRDDHPDVFELSPQVADDRFGRFGGSTGAVQNQVERVATEPMHDFHEALHVLVVDHDGRLSPRRNRCQEIRGIENRVALGIGIQLLQVAAPHPIEVRHSAAVSRARVYLIEDLPPGGHRPATVSHGVGGVRDPDFREG